MELITATLSNPTLTIFLVILIIYVGKHFFTSKQEHNNTELQICATQMDLNNAIGNLNVEISKIIGQQNEKLRIVQKETLDDVDRKYFTKELAKGHDDRITKLEELCCELKADTGKIPVMYDMIKEIKDTLNTAVTK